MTAEEAHVILAAKGVYNAGRNPKVRYHVQLDAALSELAKACAALERSERQEKSAKRTSGVMKLRLVK
jgi:hypothetical protein